MSGADRSRALNKRAHVAGDVVGRAVRKFVGSDVDGDGGQFALDRRQRFKAHLFRFQFTPASEGGTIIPRLSPRLPERP